jgi:hypothetical protein
VSSEEGTRQFDAWIRGFLKLSDTTPRLILTNFSHDPCIYFVQISNTTFALHCRGDANSRRVGCSIETSRWFLALSTSCPTFNVHAGCEDPLTDRAGLTYRSDGISNIELIRDSGSGQSIMTVFGVLLLAARRSPLLRCMEVDEVYTQEELQVYAPHFPAPLDLFEECSVSEGNLLTLL